MDENGGNASPPPLPPSDPDLKLFDSSRQARIMENLKAAVLLRLANSHPNKTFSSAQIAAIERGLAQAFPSFRTPTHPTYASMIQTAIVELDEEAGSMESSISEYIMKNYEGLPWAHKRYLSHYLDKLCENGEILCTSSKCYTIPGLIRGPKSKKKQLRPKPGRRRKENVIDHGNSGEEELIGVNENEVCFQDEETQVFVRHRAKRRRSGLVVYKEDEEVGGKEVVGREGNVIRSGKLPVIEGQNELLELDHGHKFGRDSELKQQGFGTDDKGNDAWIMGRGLPGTQQVVACKEDTGPLVGLIESTVEKLMPKEGQYDEARTNVLSSDHDPSKGRTDLLLPPVPTTVDNRLPFECEDEVKTGTMQLDSESCNANLKLVLIESVNDSAMAETNHSGSSAELILPSAEGNPAWTSVSSVEGDAFQGILKESAKWERDDSIHAADLTIVPFKGDTPVRAVQKEMKQIIKERMEIIVCGLPSHDATQPKWKQLVYRPRMRSKHRQKKPLLKSVSGFPVSPEAPKLLEFEQLPEVSLQRGHETKVDLALRNSSKLNNSSPQTQQAHASFPCEMACVKAAEEGSLKLELEKQKLHLEPTPFSGPQELMSTDDEDLNIPLQQVVQKYGKQRKLSERITRSKVPLALLPSMSGTKLQAGLPGSEDPAKMMPQRNKKLIRAKGKQRQGQQLKQKLRTQGHKRHNCRADTAAEPENEVFSLFQLEEAGDNGKESHEDQEPQLADAACDTCSMEHQHEQQEGGQDQGGCPCIQPIPEALYLHNQHHESGENLQKRRENGLSAEIEKTTDVSIREPSPPQNQNGQKEGHKLQNQTETGDVASCDSKPVTAVIMEEKGPLENELQFMEKQIKEPTGWVRGRTCEARPSPDCVPAELASSACPGEIASQQEESQCLVDSYDPERPVGELGKGNAHPVNLSTEQQIEQSKGLSQGRPPQQKEAVDETMDASLLLQSQYHPQWEGPSELTHNFITEAASVVCPFDQKKGQEAQNYGQITCPSPVQTSTRGLLHDNSPAQQPITEPPSAKQDSQCQHDQIEDQQGQAESDVGLLDPEPHFSTLVDVEVKVDTSNQPSLQQNKQVKRERRGRPRKLKVETKDVEDSLNLHHQKQEGRGESVSYQQFLQQNKQPKKDGRGRPRKQKEETESVAAPLNMHDQLQEGSFGSAIQVIKKDGLGSPRKQKEETMGNVAAPLNSHDQKKGGPSKLAIRQFSLQQSKERKRDGRGRPRKQSIVIKEDAVAPLKVHYQEQEGLFEPATREHQQRNKRPKRDGRGRPRKRKETANKDMTDSLSLMHRQLEEPSKPETHQHSQLERKQPKEDVCGRLQEQSGATEEDAVVAVQQNLDQQLQEGPSERAVQQNKLPKRVGRGRPQKQDRATKEDAAVLLNLDQQQQGRRSKPQTHHLQNKRKRDGRGSPLRKDAATKKDAAAASNLTHEEIEGQNKQTKRDHHGRPQKPGTTKGNEATLLRQQQEQPVPALCSALHASDILCQPGLKEGLQQETEQQVNVADSELSGTSEAPLSLGSQCEPAPREHKQCGQGSYMPEAAEMFLASRTLQQCPDLELSGLGEALKTTPTPVLAKDESHQQEKEHKPHLEWKQLFSPNGQPLRSQDQVHEMPSDQKQITVLSVNETAVQLKEQKEDGKGELPRLKPEIEPLVNQPCQQEGDEQCQFQQEKQGQSRYQGKTPKQKSAKTRATEVPLSSIVTLRSRIKR